MLTRWALLLIGFVMAAPAAAEDMSLEQARRFVIGKLFEASCFDGTRAIGRIYSDGSVIGTIQFRGTGPERSAWLPAGTLKVKGEAVCASDCLLSPASSSTGLAIIASAPRCGASIQRIATSSAIWIAKPISRARTAAAPMAHCSCTHALLALKSNAEPPHQ
jgi:hypothetical protein